MKVTQKMAEAYDDKGWFDVCNDYSLNRRADKPTDLTTCTVVNMQDGLIFYNEYDEEVYFKKEKGA